MSPSGAGWLLKFLQPVIRLHARRGPAPCFPCRMPGPCTVGRRPCTGRPPDHHLARDEKKSFASARAVPESGIGVACSSLTERRRKVCRPAGGDHDGPGALVLVERDGNRVVEMARIREARWNTKPRASRLSWQVPCAGSTEPGRRISPNTRPPLSWRF